MTDFETPRPQTDKTPSTRSKRVDSRPYLHGKGFVIRRQYKGNDIFVSGHKTAAAAKKELARRIRDIDDNVQPAGAGAEKTSLAQAFQDYALDRLPFLKGAEQESRRINTYLRAAGLRLLKVEKLATAEVPGKSGTGAYFKVELVNHTDDRVIPKGLSAHRRALMTANASTDKLRAVLASTPMGDVTRNMVDGLFKQMTRDGSSAATVGLERAMLRVLFNHAFVVWRWTELVDNPATRLKMPKIDNERSRVLGDDEQALLDAALSDCRNQLVEPTLTLLRETAMRASEPLEYATWGDVDWDRPIIRLPDSKGGSRDVPLSPEALVALHQLRALNPGKDSDKIVNITYEALRAAWGRAVRRAGLKNLHLHDLRRTAATRMALKTGNVFLVKVLTGHKTLAMMDRYVNVNVDDVLAVMHGRPSTGAAMDAVQAVAPAMVSRGTQEAPQVSEQASMGPAATAGGVKVSNVYALPMRRKA